MKTASGLAFAVGTAAILTVLGSTTVLAEKITFTLTPIAKFANCIAAFPGDLQNPPTATVTVARGARLDTMTITLTNFKDGLDFDLFTVQNSSLQSDGSPNPAFTNFGLAWYQSDIHVTSLLTGKVTVKTILLDQIFGFDPAASLAPTNTFHVGFWFNNPADAAPCGFDTTHPTPFNGEHKAGPLAMISLPNATTNLGPLCTKPDLSTSPPSCKP